MRMRSLWEITPPAIDMRTVLYILLAIGAIVGGGAMAPFFLHMNQKTTPAAVILQVATTKQPWDITLDSKQHVWVAQPNCDPSPICPRPPGPGAITEYDTLSLAKIREFTPPHLYNPTFLELDGSGNVWFTDPSHGAIGKLVPETNTWIEFPIPGATPYDLIFDDYGHLWFTDFTRGIIGAFDTRLNTLISLTSTPTPSHLYGLAKGSDGTIWFAENNTPFVGSFKPPVNGKLTTANIREHRVLTNQQHMITVDRFNNVWFSTGFHGQIGLLPFGSNKARTYCVSTASKGDHISGIAVDNIGRVWFDDSINNRIGYLDPTRYNNNCVTGSTSGVVTMKIPANSHPHDGLLVDSQNNVFFTQMFSYQLSKITAGILPPVPTPTTVPTSPGVPIRPGVFVK